MLLDQGDRLRGCVWLEGAFRSRLDIAGKRVRLDEVCREKCVSRETPGGQLVEGRVVVELVGRLVRKTFLLESARWTRTASCPGSASCVSETLSSTAWRIRAQLASPRAKRIAWDVRQSCLRRLCGASAAKDMMGDAIEAAPSAKCGGGREWLGFRLWKCRWQDGGTARQIEEPWQNGILLT